MSDFILSFMMYVDKRFFGMEGGVSKMLRF